VRLVRPQSAIDDLGDRRRSGHWSLFAYLVAAMPSETGKHYYLEIMLPGFVVGAIIGFLTQRMGISPAASRP